MQLEPPDYETCASIVDNAEYRSDHSSRDGLGLLALAILMAVLVYTSSDFKSIDGTFYMSVKGIFYSCGVINFLVLAYLRAFGTKNGRVLVWFAREYIKNNCVEYNKSKSEQAASRNR